MEWKLPSNMLSTPPAPSPLGCFPSLQLANLEQSAYTLKKQMNRFHQTSTIAFKGGKVLLSLLVGVEVCEAVLDGVGEDKLLQVHHLERKKLVILM